MFKGYNKDTTYVNMQTGESPFAKNIVVTEKYKSISNEPGFSKQVTIPGLLIGLIETSYKDVLFIKNGETDEIGIFTGFTYTCVIKGNFGFDLNYPIEGDFKYNFGQQLIVAWTDNLNSPRILNLDCLPFEIEEDCTLVNNSDFRLVDLNPELKIPEITLLPHAFGGNIQTGAYWAFIAYEYEDSTRTNWIKSSNTIIVTDNNPGDTYTEYDGSEGGNLVNKIIELKLTNIDTAFSKIVLGFIRQRNGIQDAFIANSFLIEAETQTVRYDGTENVIAVALEELLVPNQVYLKAKTLKALDDRLHLGGVTTEGEIDWQTYANNVEIRWVYGNPMNLVSTDESYKDPVVFFNERTFRADEVYDFYVVFKLKTGSYSQAFHIPGIEEDVISINNSNFPQSYKISTAIDQGFILPDAEEYVNIDPEAKLFHLVNTAEVVTNTPTFLEGTMGFFQNLNTRYPEESCSNITDCDGNVIGTLANKRKRFHRFPSISQLTDWIGNYISYGKNDSESASLEATGFTLLPGSPTTAALDYEVLANSLPPTLDSDASPDGTIQYIATETGTYRFKINTRIFDFRNNLDIKIGTVIGGVTSFILDVEQPDSVSNRDYLITIDETVELAPGDRFFVDVKLIANTIYHGGSVSNTTNTFTIAKIDVSNLNTDVRRLGIRLRNICIPDEIKNKVEHLEIFYAKRTFNNSTVVGQSLLDLDSRTNVRAYDFDLLKSKASVGLTHINTELTFEATSPNFISGASIAILNKIKQIEFNRFIPANISVPVDNRKREEYIQLSLSNLTDLPSDKLVLANLKTHKTNLYQQVELISTGYIIDTSTTNSFTIYGGDTIISAYGHLHSSPSDNGFYSATTDEITAVGRFDTYVTSKLGAIPNPSIVDQAKIIFFSLWFYPVESTFNIGLRHVDEVIENNNYYPNSTNLPTDIDEVIDKTLFPLIETNDYFTGENNITYNYDFHAFHPSQEIQIFACDKNCYSDNVYFPTRVARSIVSNNEEYTLSWRTFLVNDYYEMPKDKGIIWKLEVFNQALIIHLEYSLFIAIVKDKLALNIQEVFLGTGDIFDRRPDEVVGTHEGYAGTQSQWGSFVCKLGYVFVDLNQGKVFLFNGKLKELSNSKMRNWFTEYFTSNNSITDRTAFPVIDNPYVSSGVVAWYDEKYDRILVGYKSRSVGSREILPSLQLSYYPGGDYWISEHDYFPSYAYQSRRGIFSVDNDVEENTCNIYLHNQNNKSIFYDDTTYASYIDIVLKAPQNQQVRWDAVFWNTVVEKESKTFKDKTFTHILIYTEDQCTGIIELDSDKSLFNNSDRNTRNTKYTWKFNKLRDIAENRDEVIIDEFGNVNLINLKNDPSWFELSKFYNNFIVVRFIYDNIEQNNIHLNEIDVNIVKKRR